MKQRILLFDIAARERLKVGIDALADMVQVTLGPKGNNVIIERSVGSPLITKDGVTVAKEVFLEDPVSNIGAQLLKEVASKTNETAGDGTTTATVLARALVFEGVKNVTAGAHAMDLKRGMDIAVKQVVEELKRNSKAVQGKNDIINIASISANNDIEVGTLIAEAIERAGEEGIVIVEDAKGADTVIDAVEGLQFDRGFTYKSFVNKKQANEVELNNVYVLLCNFALKQLSTLASLLESALSRDENASFLIIADEFGDDVTRFLITNSLKGNIRCCTVISPGYGDRRVDLLDDIAVATGGTVLSSAGVSLSAASLMHFGKADKAVIRNNSTVIVGGKGDSEKVQETIDNIRNCIAQASTDFDKQKLQERLGKLTGGIVMLRVGAITETELKEKKMRIEDALHATRAALEEGVVPGGGVALVRARKILLGLEADREDIKTGIKIVYNALEVPLLSICKNAGVSGEVILHEISSSVDNFFGYNALTDHVTDLYVDGVIDPLKVVRLALENAVSVVSLFLTTKGVIAQSIEEKEYIDKLMMQSV